jgi:hypothetical protein
MPMLAEFRRRAWVYSHWDVRLSRQTRFFAAAAVTNAALAELFAWGRARLLLSNVAASFLSEVGLVLEQQNLRLARQMAGQPPAAPDLDRSIIRWEQNAVEVMLCRLRCFNAATHQHVIMQINRLLQPVRTGCPARWFFPHAVQYAQVLRSACSELGRPTDFSIQTDRELIGLILIARLSSDQNLRTAQMITKAASVRPIPHRRSIPYFAGQAVYRERIPDSLTGFDAQSEWDTIPNSQQEAQSNRPGGSRNPDRGRKFPSCDAELRGNRQ